MRKTDFQFLIEHTADMICEVGADLTMHYASPACGSLLGWKPREMIGKSPDAFVHPSDLPVVRAAREALFRHGVDQTPPVIRMRKKGGAYVWMEVNARLVRDPEDDSVKSIVLVMRDVCSRLARHGLWNIHPEESDLESSFDNSALEFFYKVFRLSPVPMMMTTFSGFRLIDVNAAFSETLGYAPGDVIGRGALSVGLVSKLHLDRITTPLRDIGYVKDVEIDMRHRDGTQRHCLLSAEAMVLREQRCVLSVLQDVTRQRRTDGDVIAALEIVMRDASWFGRAVMEKLVQVRRQNGAVVSDAEPVGLSAREYRVLGLMCEGLDNTEIAAALSLSSNTVRNHISSIYGKIGVHTRAAAIVWARERGVSTQESPDIPKKNGRYNG